MRVASLYDSSSRASSSSTAASKPFGKRASFVRFLQDLVVKHGKIKCQSKKNWIGLWQGVFAFETISGNIQSLSVHLRRLVVRLVGGTSVGASVLLELSKI